MKYLILVSALLLSISGWSQELPFLFKGRVENSDVGGYEGGVTIAVVQNGSTVFSVVSASNGKYTLRGNINYGTAFDIVFTKGGLVSKKVHFDLTSMNEEDIPAGEARPVEQLNMTMFKERPDIDFSFLNTEPVASFDWNTRQMSASLDAVASQKMKAKIEKLLLDEEKNKAENEAKYNEAIFQADAAYDKEEYEKALGKYEEALGYKPKEEHPLNRIAELDALIQAQKEAALADEQEREEYDNLIAAADNLRDGGDLESALTKYKEAIVAKGDEQYPKDQVSEISAKVAAAKKEAENQAAYDAAVRSGESFLKQNSLKAAKDKFEEARDLKPSEALPKQKLAEIAKKLDATKELEEKKKKYEEALAAADGFFDAEDYQSAKDKYVEALSFEASSSYAKGRKQVCDDKLAESNAAAEKLQQIQDLLDAGNASLDSKAYSDAISSFEGVLALEAEHPEGKEKLALAKQKLEEVGAEAAKEQEVKDLVEQGDQKFDAKSYQEAIDKYEAANAIISSAEVTSKIADATAKLAEEAAATAEIEKFNQLIEEGEQLIAADKLTEAKAKFNEAAGIDGTSPIPPAKISEIDGLLANQQAASDKKAQYDGLIVEANGLFDSSKWTDAEGKYTEALALADDKSYAQGRIDEIKAKIAEEASLADRQEKYDGLIAEASTEYDGSNWTAAETKYKEALNFTDDKSFAQGKIDEIQQKLAGEQAASERQAKYDGLIAEGNESFDGSNWTEAETKYQEALNYTEDKSYAQGRLDEIQQKLAGDKAVAEREAKYKDLMEEGGTAFTGQDWTSAESKYREALNYTDDKSDAQAKIDEIAKIKGEQANVAQEQAEIASLLQEGNNLFGAKDYDKAKEKYQEVTSRDASNTEAIAQLEKVNSELAALQSDAQNEETFQKLKTEGFDLVDKEDYTGAKQKLNEALSMKADSEITAKIAEIEQKEKALADQASIDEDYDALLAEAKDLGDDKKYDDAIAKYKEALAVKPTEPAPLAKIEALKKLKAGDTEQEEINKKYDALMQKGEDLMAQENYTDAIKTFNNALGVKPGEQLPVERAAEAERMSKESTSDFDKQINKNLGVAEKKIQEGNYPKALNILDLTEKLDPDNERIKEMRREIADLKKKETDYIQFMADAESLEATKNYTGAKAKYEAANGVNPTEQKPIDKIEEMKKLIELQASSVQKDQLYNDYMSDGGKKLGRQEYQLALSTYQNALSVRPGDVAASAKISEIEQILDNLANASADEIKKQNEFDAFIKKADALFGGDKNYPKAKGEYENALAIFPDNKYAKLQVDECIRLSREELSAEEEKQYRKLIAAADKNFNGENYDKAKGYYTTAVSLRNTDQYPQEKLAEIEAIINPQTREIAELEDLGDPYDGSILDGGFLLAQAEEERKLLNDQKVTDKLDNIYSTESDLTTEKTQDQRDNTNRIYQVQRSIELDEGESDLGRQETVKTLRDAELELSATDRKNDAFEKAENLSDQEALYSINEEVALDYGSRDEVHKENTEKLDVIDVAIDEANRERGLVETSDSYNENRRINDIKVQVRGDNIDDIGERAALRQEVYEAQVLVADENYEIEVNNYDKLIETEEVIGVSHGTFTQRQEEDRAIALANNEELKAASKGLSDANDELSGIETEDHYGADAQLTDIKEGVDYKTAEDTKISLENNDQLTVVKLDIADAEADQEVTEMDHARKTDRDMATIKNKIDVEQTAMDDNREIAVEVIKTSQKELADSHADDFNNALAKRVETKAKIDEQVVVNGKIDEVAELALDKKIDYVNTQEDKARTNFEGIALSDEAERLNTDKSIQTIYSDAAAEASTDAETQEESSQALEATKRVITKKDENQSIGKQEELQNTAGKIHDIDDSKDKKVKTANSLGEEYPEGVSQESFTQSDQNGLMKAVVTRRIVVIDGHADVYVRTQTLSAITYTKNGKPSLSHVWNSETQGPQLERHY